MTSPYDPGLESPVDPPSATPPEDPKPTRAVKGPPDIDALIASQNAKKIGRVLDAYGDVLSNYDYKRLADAYRANVVLTEDQTRPIVYLPMPETSREKGFWDTILRTLRLR